MKKQNQRKKIFHLDNYWIKLIPFYVFASILFFDISKIDSRNNFLKNDLQYRIIKLNKTLDKGSMKSFLKEKNKFKNDLVKVSKLKLINPSTLVKVESILAFMFPEASKKKFVDQTSANIMNFIESTRDKKAAQIQYKMLEQETYLKLKGSYKSNENYLYHKMILKIYERISLMKDNT